MIILYPGSKQLPLQGISPGSLYSSKTWHTALATSATPLQVLPTSHVFLSAQGHWQQKLLVSRGRTSADRCADGRGWAENQGACWSCEGPSAGARKHRVCSSTFGPTAENVPRTCHRLWGYRSSRSMMFSLAWFCPLASMKRVHGVV